MIGDQVDSVFVQKSKPAMFLSRTCTVVCCVFFVGCGVGSIGADLAPTGSAGGSLPIETPMDSGGTDTPGSIDAGASPLLAPPSAPDAAPPAAVASGLPCEVDAIVTKYCSSCHGARPLAPMSLVQYADFSAPARSNSAQTNAQLSLQLMTGTSNPMPPSGARPTSTELQVFASWVNGGTPKGFCGTAEADAGISSDAGTSSIGDAGSTTPPPVPGLPCEVSTLLATYCVSCHGSHLLGGAPMSLVTYADLAAKTPSDASKTAAQLSYELMTGSVNPMPPAGPRPSASQLSAFSAWLALGAPETGCGSSSGDAGVVVPVDPYGTPSVCTSAVRWNGRESATMRPGQACISCHTSQPGAPQFAIAGTVYPTAHEPDLCNGSSAAATIEITDKNGVVHKLTANTVGNFDLTTKVALPYKATVTFQGRTRTMASAQTSGDCNTCHTESGTSGAPGRIMLP